MTAQAPTINTTGYPGWKAKLACLLYEALIVIAIAIVGLIIPHSLLGAAAGIVVSGKALVAHLFLMLLIYFSWQWLHGGQTLAMKTWKIRIASSDEKPLRPAQVLLRFALAWPGTLFLGVGFFWAILDKDGQYLHDRLAGTQLEDVSGDASQPRGAR